MDLDSSCASDDRMVSSTSPFESRLSIFSFSNVTPIPSSFSSLTYLMQSNVFLANLLIDLTKILSTLPPLQSCIRRLKASRFFVLVAEIPSSA